MYPRRVDQVVHATERLLDTGDELLDRSGIAVRAGHHCAQPLMNRFGVSAMVRASIGLYNTVEDADALAAGIAKVTGFFGR